MSASPDIIPSVQDAGSLHAVENHSAPATAHSEASPTAPKKSGAPRTPFGRNAANTPAEGATFAVDRLKMVDATPLGPSIDKDGKFIAGSEKTDKLPVPESVAENQVAFVQAHVTRLNALKERDFGVDQYGNKINMYEAMKQQEMASGDFRPEDDLLIELFSNIDPTTKVPKLKDAAEIAKIIKDNPRAMFGVLIAQEKWSNDIDAALGRRRVLTPHGKKVDLQRLSYSVDLTGKSKGLGAVGGAETKGKLGSAVDSIMGRLADDGITLDFVPDDIARNVALNAQSIRMIELVQIDPRNPLASQVLEARNIEVIKNTYQRAEFMLSLGMNPREIGASSEEYIFKANHINNLRPGENNSWMAIETRSRLRQLVAEDARARAARRATGATVDDISMEEYRFLHRRAESEILVKFFNEARQNLHPTQSKTLEQLAAQKKLRQPGEGGSQSTLQEERTRAATEKVGLLNKDQGVISASKEKFDAQQAKLDEAQAARDILRRTLKRVTSQAGPAAPGGRLPPAVTYTDHEAAIVMATEVMTLPGANKISFPDANGRLLTISSLVEQRAALETLIEREQLAAIAAMPSQGPKESDASFQDRQDQIKTNVRKRYDGKFAEITTQQEKLNDFITRLTDMNKAIETATNTAIKSPEQQAASDTLKSYDDAYDQVDNILATLPPPPPNPANLDALMAAINTAYERSLATGTIVGWPKSENTTEARRELARKSLIRGTSESSLQGLGAPVETAFLDITENPDPSLRISAEQLRAMSMTQLEQLADELLIPPAGKAKLADAQKYAKAQVSTLLEAMENESKQIEQEKLRLNADIASQDLSKEVAQIEVAETIVGHKADTLSKANEIHDGDKSHAMLQNDMILPTAPGEAEKMGYTSAEAASKLPGNVLELLNLMTGYQSAADRAAQFDKIWTAFKKRPDILERYLFESFGPMLVIPTAPGMVSPAPIYEFSTRLKESIRMGSIRKRDLVAAMDTLTDKFGEWGINLWQP